MQTSSHPLAMRSLPSSSDESSDEEIMALETILLFCLAESPSSTVAEDFLADPLFPLPSDLLCFSLLRPRSRSSPLVFLRDFPSDFFFLTGAAPSSPLFLYASEPSVTKPSSSFFLFRPWRKKIHIKRRCQLIIFIQVSKIVLDFL